MNSFRPGDLIVTRPMEERSPTGRGRNLIEEKTLGASFKEFKIIEQISAYQTLIDRG